MTLFGTGVFSSFPSVYKIQASVCSRTLVAAHFCAIRHLVWKSDMNNKGKAHTSVIPCIPYFQSLKTGDSFPFIILPRTEQSLNWFHP